MNKLSRLLTAACLASVLAFACITRPPVAALPEARNIVSAPAKTPEVVCIWPDPVIFSLNDDNWFVCFQIEREGNTAPFRCKTVAQLRQLANPLSAH